MDMNITIRPCRDRGFSHKIEFTNLVRRLEHATDYKVCAVATGRASTPALRVRLDGPVVEDSPHHIDGIELRIAPNGTHARMNCKVAFGGLSEALARKRITLAAAESCENGPGTEAALRFKLSNYDREEVVVDSDSSPGLNRVLKPRAQGHLVSLEHRRAMEKPAVQVAQESMSPAIQSGQEERQHEKQLSTEPGLMASGQSAARRIEVKVMPSPTWRLSCRSNPGDRHPRGSERQRPSTRDCRGVRIPESRRVHTELS